ncbi:DUF6192 family protein [Streptomyces sp. NPDC001868]|uniref:DUF6192 family protein n=1 Tax=Streptomyces sp. NPDC001868 TaxID=3154401 RepID=UPI0033198D68
MLARCLVMLVVWGGVWVASPGRGSAADAGRRRFGTRRVMCHRPQEKVEAIRELARDDEAVAAQVATDFLRRPEVWRSRPCAIPRPGRT